MQGVPEAFIECLKRAAGLNWSPKIFLCSLCQFCGHCGVFDFGSNTPLAKLAIKYRACGKCVALITEAQAGPPGTHPDCDVTHPLVLECSSCREFYPVPWALLQGTCCLGKLS